MYLHLPFCFHKCHYCDFYSVVDPPGASGGDRQAAFTDALCAELRELTARHGESLSPDTIFAGGGTPTYLRAKLWDRLFGTLRDLGLLDRVAEFTVEANPETVTPALMRRLAAGGVNRVSIGAQSFDRASLAALERWHDPDNVPRAVEASRAAGIDNLSLDLIFAVPGQTLAMLDADLDRLLELEPTHLSTYGLTYEPQTPLAARLRLGRVTAVDDETERQMYERILERLGVAGFVQYEVSNWARVESGSGKAEGGSSEQRVNADTPPSLASDTSAFRLPPSGFQCRHNLHYWHNHDWLGAGPGAASHRGGHRWRNAPNLKAYLDAAPHPPTQDHERLDPDARLGERLMLGLRLREGVSITWLDANLPADDRRHAAIDEMIDIGMLERTATHLRLTRPGLFVADSVIVKLL
ncbi:MAG: coproporphyrinogen-III oxidase family protein [Planctomycetota bacterium]